MEVTLISLAVTLGIQVAVLGFIFSMVPVGLWLTALFSGVSVNLGTLIGMRMRKVNPADIIRPLISATKAGLSLDIGQMEAHYLAGGHVSTVAVNSRSSACMARVTARAE